MNAIQFVKEKGVDKAREVIDGAPDRATTVKPSLDFKHFMYGICENAAGAYILLSELKHLVESVAIVESLGGIDQAKLYISLNDNQHSIMLIYRMITSDEIKQAIADYELIYSNDIGDDAHIENHVSPLCKMGVK